MRAIPKAIKIAILAAVAVCAIIAGVLYLQRPAAATPPFTLARVDRGDVVQTVETTGKLVPLVSVEISTQISGLVTNVMVDFNSRVSKGELLATIDSSTYEQTLRRAQADLDAAEALHGLNTTNVNRTRRLLAKELVTRQEHEERETAWRQSQASLLTRRAEVQNAKLDLERCRITSPIDGIVIFKQIEVGKTIVSSFNAPTLFAIAPDLSRMRILAPISEVDVWSVQEGQDVSFTVDALPRRRFSGRLTQIRNPYTPSEKQQQASAQTREEIATFDAVIEVDNRDLLLRPSLNANVSIIVTRRNNVLRIPNSALRVQLQTDVSPPQPGPELESTHMASIYRMPGGKRTDIPQPVRVRIGISDGVRTEILRGLTEGDWVVTGIASEWEQQKARLFR